MPAVPHFTVTTISGERVEYARIWQLRNLVLVTLPQGGSPEASGDTARLQDALSHLASDTAVVITRDPITGVMPSSAVVADRWGEVIYSVRTEHVADLPDAQELLDWVEHVRQRCPECEGESR